jgi:hypothetical protein
VGVKGFLATKPQKPKNTKTAICRASIGTYKRLLLTQEVHEVKLQTLTAEKYDHRKIKNPLAGYPRPKSSLVGNAISHFVMTQAFLDQMECLGAL